MAEEADQWKGLAAGMCWSLTIVYALVLMKS